eukprot:Nk52_evm23s1916 gene=Nk52_evmTU23s1916
MWMLERSTRSRDEICNRRVLVKKGLHILFFLCLLPFIKVLVVEAEETIDNMREEKANPATFYAYQKKEMQDTDSGKLVESAKGALPVGGSQGDFEKAKEASANIFGESGQQQERFKDNDIKGAQVNQFTGEASSYGPTGEGQGPLQMKAKFSSPVEVLALSGYDIVYDTETVPIFELTGTMRAANIAAVLVNAYGPSLVKTQSTSLTNLKDGLESLRKSRQMNSETTGKAGGGASSFTANLGLTKSLSKSESASIISKMTSKGKRRVMRIEITIPEVTVILTRQNMRLRLGFLEDLRRLPLIPIAENMTAVMDGKMSRRQHKNIPGVPTINEFMNDPQYSDVLLLYFSFFGRYGTHYRAKSRYGGRLEFFFAKDVNQQKSEDQEAKTSLRCSAAAAKVSAQKISLPGVDKSQKELDKLRRQSSFNSAEDKDTGPSNFNAPLKHKVGGSPSSDLAYTQRERIIFGTDRNSKKQTNSIKRQKKVSRNKDESSQDLKRTEDSNTMNAKRKTTGQTEHTPNAQKSGSNPIPTHSVVTKKSEKSAKPKEKKDFSSSYEDRDTFENIFGDDIPLFDWETLENEFDMSNSEGVNGMFGHYRYLVSHKRPSLRASEVNNSLVIDFCLSRLNPNLRPGAFPYSIDSEVIHSPVSPVDFGTKQKRDDPPYPNFMTSSGPVWERILDVIAMRKYVASQKVKSHLPDALNSLWQSTGASFIDHAIKEKALGVNESPNTPDEGSAIQKLFGKEKNKLNKIASSGSNPSDAASRLMQLFSDHAQTPQSEENAMQSVNDLANESKPDPWMSILGQRYYDLLYRKVIGIKTDQDRDGLTDIQRAQRLQKEKADIDSKNSMNGQLTLGMSMSDCLAETEQAGSMNAAMDESETYEVSCHGGLTCESLLLMGTMPIADVQQSCRYWARSVKDFPVFLDTGGSALDYVPLSAIFDDVIHWWKNDTNVTGNGDSDEMKEFLARDRKARQASVTVALQAYLLLFGSDFGSVVAQCSRNECPSKPYMRSDGTCGCPTHDCPIDLLSRLSQAGGETTDYSSRERRSPLSFPRKRFGLREAIKRAKVRRSAGSSLSSSCGLGHFYDTVKEKCAPLMEKYINCVASKKISIRLEACVDTCGEDEEEKIYEKERYCMVHKEKKGVLNRLIGTLKYTTSKVMGGMDGETLKSVTDFPKLCKDIVKFCVPLCGSGTFLTSVAVPNEDGSKRYVQKCVSTCPEGTIADQKLLKCISQCPSDMWMRYDSKLGNYVCSSSCGTDVGFVTPLQKLCIRNAILGFYNISVHLAAYPDVNCGIGGAYATDEGFITLDKAGKGSVSSNGLAVKFLITSLNVKDITFALDRMAMDVRQYKKSNPYVDVIKCLTNAKAPDEIDDCTSQIEDKDVGGDMDRLQSSVLDMASMKRFTLWLGCEQDSYRFPSLSLIRCTQHFESSARIIMLLDSADLKPLVVDFESGELRKGRPGEAPVGLLPAGDIGGSGGMCLSGLSSSHRCHPLHLLKQGTIEEKTTMLNMSDSNDPYIDREDVALDRSVTGNFVPMLHYDPVRGGVSLNRLLAHDGPQLNTTILTFHPLSDVTQITGGCSGDAQLFNNVKDLNLKLPRLPKVRGRDFTKGGGYSFVLGGLSLGDLKARSRPTAERSAFSETFMTWRESYIQGFADSYILSDANARCFIACHQYIFNCDIYCADKIDDPNRTSKLWRKELEPEILMRLFDFRNFQRGGGSVHPLLEPLSKCRMSSNFDFNPSCLAAINVVATALSTGRSFSSIEPSFTLSSVLKQRDSSTPVRVDLVKILERMLLTRDYVFQIPYDLSIGASWAEDESVAGVEAINYRAILESYRKRIAVAKMFTLNGVTRARQTRMLQTIDEHYQTLVSVPKTRVSNLQDKKTLSDIASEFNSLDAPTMTIGLQGCLGTCRILLSVCLHGGKRVWYDTQPKKEIVSVSSRRKRSLDTIVSTMNKNTSWGLQHRNEDKIHGEDLCPTGLENSFLCMIGYEVKELVVVQFVVEHVPSSSALADHADFDKKLPLKLEQVCPVRGVCKSSRFVIPETDGKGYVMFLLDLENKILRFDLLHLTISHSEDDQLSYLSHRYADYTCFEDNSCYNMDSLSSLTLRDSPGSVIAPSVNQVFVKDVLFRFNDTAYFNSNPFAGYLGRCYPSILANPAYNNRALLLQYARFNFNKTEFQDTLFVYNCNFGCERRILTMGLNTGKFRDIVEFNFATQRDTFDSLIESVFNVQSINRRIRRPLVAQYSSDYTADAAETDRTRISIDEMEQTLFNVSGYQLAVNTLKSEIESRKNKTGVFEPLLLMLHFINERLSIISEFGKAGFLSRPSTVNDRGVTWNDTLLPEIDSREGQMFRLSHAPIDIFSRYFAEMKLYFSVTEQVKLIVTLPEEIISLGQRKDAQRHVLEVFQDVKERINLIETENAMMSGSSSAPAPLPWRTLEKLSSSLLDSSVRAFPHLYVTMGNYIVYVNRTNSTYQMHCISRGQKPCLVNHTESSFLSAAEAAIILRYEFDTIKGDIRLELISPCLSPTGGSSDTFIPFRNTNPESSKSSILESLRASLNVDKEYCVPTVISFRSISITPGQEIYNQTVGPFLVVLSRYTYTPTQLGKGILKVIDSFYPIDATLISRLGLYMCGRQFSFDKRLSANGFCSCKSGFLQPNCQCSRARHEIETLNGDCVCDYVRHYTSLFVSNRRECRCDSNNFFIEDPNGSSVCLCDKEKHRIYNPRTRKCECDRLGGYVESTSDGIFCEYRPAIRVRLWSVRKVACAFGTCFSFSEMRCIEKLGGLCEGIANTSGDIKNETPNFENAGSFNTANVNEMRSTDRDTSTISNDNEIDANPYTDNENGFVNTVIEASKNNAISFDSQMQVDSRNQTFMELSGTRSHRDDGHFIDSDNEVYVPSNVREIGGSVVLAEYELNVNLMPSGFLENRLVARLGLNTITEITIHNVTLNSIPDNFFSALKNVVKLSITSTSLSHLDDKASLSGLKSLTDLNLKNNGIRAIADYVLDNVPHLEKIDLRNNPLTYVDTTVVCGLKKLKLLVVDKEVQACLPAHLFNRQDFKIQCSDQMTIVPSVDLSSRFKCTEYSVCGSTVSTQCRSSKLAEIPSSLFCTPQTVIPVPDPNEGLKITLINQDSNPHFFAKVEFAKYFSSGARASLQFDYGGVKVDVKKMATVVVHDAVVPILHINFLKGLQFVKTLIFANCDLFQIEPGAFKEMSSLKNLFLTGSKLKHLLAGVFDGIMNIENLNLSGNQIETIDEDALVLPSLRHLNLAGNRISSLQRMVFSRLPNLVSLNIASNRLADMPNSIFERLQSIQDIDISHNAQRYYDLHFTDLQGIPKSVTFDINTIACLPYDIYSRSRLLPVTENIFCTDSRKYPSPTGLSPAQVCPPNVPLCPPTGKSCTKNEDCSRSRFKGAVNYCSDKGSCVCDTYLGGALCSIPLASVSVRVEGGLWGDKYYFYENVPLYPASLRALLPSGTSSLNITSPFIDNFILNGGMLLDLASLSHLQVNTIIPSSDPLVLEDDFFLAHPLFLSPSDFVVIPYPSWNRRKYEPWNSRVHLSPSTADMMRVRRDDSPNARSITNEYATENGPPDTKSPAAKSCNNLKAIFSAVKVGMQSMDSRREEQLVKIMSTLDSTACIAKANNEQHLISGNYSSEAEFINIGTIPSGEQRSFSFRIILVSSRTSELSLFKRIVPPSALYTWDIIVDLTSKFWPDTSVIFGQNVLVYAPRLTFIGPMHFSSLYAHIFFNTVLAYEAGIDWALNNLFINYVPFEDMKSICEPRPIFASGVRANSLTRMCYGCSFPSECDFIAMEVEYSKDSSLNNNSQASHIDIVFGFASRNILTIRQSTCTIARSICNHFKIHLEDVRRIAFAMSSCSALGLFVDQVCFDQSNMSFANYLFSSMDSFEIRKYRSSEDLGCRISSLNLDCFIAPKRNFFSIKVGISSDIDLLLRLDKSVLERDMLASDNRLPASTIIIVDNPDKTNIPSGSFLNHFRKKTLTSVCSSYSIRVRTCSNNCFSCEISNYSQVNCDENSRECPSLIATRPCSGHGICHQGSCICDDGWAGTDCRNPLCSYKDQSPLPCSGNGHCGLLSGKCECFAGRGDLCSRCATSLDCKNKGLCKQGRCICTPAFGGPLCEFRYVNVQYGVHKWSREMLYTVEKILLKPFMFTHLMPKFGSCVIDKVKDITSVGISLWYPSDYAKSLNLDRGWSPEVPPYTFFGLSSLIYLDLYLLLPQERSFNTITSSAFVNLPTISGRAFDTVDTLHHLNISADQSICASSNRAFSLRGTNTWTRKCEVNIGCCKSDILQRPALFSFEIKPHEVDNEQQIGPLLQYIPLTQQFWKPNYLPVELFSKAQGDINSKWPSWNYYLRSVFFPSHPKNVQFDSGRLSLFSHNQTAIAPAKSKTTFRSAADQDAKVSKPYGAQAVSSFGLGLGITDISLTLAITCKHRSAGASVKLLDERCFSDDLYRTMTPLCLGVITIFDLSLLDLDKACTRTSSSPTETFNDVPADFSSSEIMQFLNYPSVEVILKSSTCKELMANKKYNVEFQTIKYGTKHGRPDIGFAAGADNSSIPYFTMYGVPIANEKNQEYKLCPQIDVTNNYRADNDLESTNPFVLCRLRPALIDPAENINADGLNAADRKSTYNSSRDMRFENTANVNNVDHTSVIDIRVIRSLDGVTILRKATHVGMYENIFSLKSSSSLHAKLFGNDDTAANFKRLAFSTFPAHEEYNYHDLQAQTNYGRRGSSSRRSEAPHDNANKATNGDVDIDERPPTLMRIYSVRHGPSCPLNEASQVWILLDEKYHRRSSAKYQYDYDKLRENEYRGRGATHYNSILPKLPVELSSYCDRLGISCRVTFSSSIIKYSSAARTSSPKSRLTSAAVPHDDLSNAFLYNYKTETTTNYDDNEQNLYQAAGRASESCTLIFVSAVPYLDDVAASILMRSDKFYKYHHDVESPAGRAGNVDMAADDIVDDPREILKAIDHAVRERWSLFSSKYIVFPYNVHSFIKRRRLNMVNITHIHEAAASSWATTSTQYTSTSAPGGPRHDDTLNNDHPDMPSRDELEAGLLRLGYIYNV